MKEFIISETTLNKIVKVIEDKPFKIVIDLLNEIRAKPVQEEEIIDAKPDNEN